jgi:hypothetical protein
MPEGQTSSDSSLTGRHLPRSPLYGSGVNVEMPDNLAHAHVAALCAERLYFAFVGQIAQQGASEWLG